MFFIVSLCSTVIAAEKSFVDYEANDAAKRELVHELHHYRLFLRGLSKGSTRSKGGSFSYPSKGSGKGGKKSKGGSFSYPIINHGKGGNKKARFYHGWLVEGSYPSKGKKTSSTSKGKVTTSSKKQSSTTTSTSSKVSSSGSTSHQSFSW